MTASFEPIAIVGAGCVLPGALDRHALADLVFDGRTAISDVDPDRWRVDPERIDTDPAHPEPERAWTRRGGYVRGFDATRATRRVPGAAGLRGRDPLVTWLLDAGRQALDEAGLVVGGEMRGGLVAGNLSFPTESAAKFAEKCWIGDHEDGPNGASRFMSGGAVDVVATTLGLSLGGLGLDAACASSLYAIELACRRLQARDADVMLAGAVNRADDLFLHVGFCALNAMSRTGRSRPFHADADGLIPAEGAAVVALRRLDDAIADGGPILGVIRGIGLSNDGRGPSFLAPSMRGQVAAIEQAWRRAGLDPATVGFVECHATGTPVGDRTELGSLARVFPRACNVPIGSLKSNIGHGITVAGVAGLLKVLAAFERDALPPTPGVDAPIAAAADGGFDIVDAPRPWGDRPRRAAVSAFGFGGNNAHLVVDAWDGASDLPSVEPPRRDAAVALVAIDAIAGSAEGIDAVLDRLRAPSPERPDGRIESVDVALRGLRVPPRDLDETLPQQLLALGLARRLAAAVPVDAARTSVFVGMGVDLEIARYGLRWRQANGLPEAIRDAIVPPLTAAGVVGTMPNIPANRVNRQIDARGPSFTVSSEERSGLDALAIAVDGLRGRDIDAALVLAVDVSDEPAHAAAARACLPDALHVPGDAVWGAVVVRHEDALEHGWPVIGRIEPSRSNEERSEVDEAPNGDGPDTPELVVGPAQAIDFVTPRFGHAHAASGLAALLAATALARLDALPDATPRPSGWTDVERCVSVRAGVLGQGVREQFTVRVLGSPSSLPPVPALDGPARAWPAHRPPVPALSLDVVVESDLAGKSTPTTPIEPHPSAPARRVDSGPTHHAAPTARTHDEPRHRATGESAMHDTMPPAPALPSILASHAPPAPITVHGVGGRGDEPTAPPASPLERLAPTSPAGLAAPTADAPAAQAWMQARAEITRLHLDFVAHSAQAERAFASYREARRAELLRWVGAPSLLAFAEIRPSVETTGPVPPVARASVAPTAPAPPTSTPSAVEPTRRPSAVESPRSTSSSAAPMSAVPAAPAATSAMAPAVAPLFDRDDLECLARGQISRWFGAQFEAQDAYPVQVRMPEPPMLLCDRILDIDAEPATMKTGRIRTETDVTEDAWYLVDGRMPAGLMIEAGQADLLLISWLGIDLETRGERRYRLLGCELTWHDSPPAVGETLHFDIRIEGHARHGDVRLFFFNYDCTCAGAKRLTVREGQAGFFTEDELEASAGVLWNPADTDLSAENRIDRPVVPSVPAALTREQLAMIADGRVFEALGDAWRRTASHTRTPSLPGGRLELLECVEAIEVDGGPWGRGYLRAIDTIAPDDWFFDGHFFNDPCMPGTLMLEGCLHAMATWMIATGHTIHRDGWRFEPVPEQPYKMRCRGQVDPGSQRLVYEVHVREVHDGPWPTVYADLLCIVDGLGAFHCERMGLRLVPDWPTEGALGLSAPPTPDRAAAMLDGVRLDESAMLHTAIGRPSRAFGSMYDRFDGGAPVARLPGPPYLCVSRIAALDGHADARAAGNVVTAEWDVPADADLSSPVPYAWVLEAGLQPCGWCAAWSGGALTRDEGLYFRNLDGEGVIHRTVRGDADRTLSTRAACTAFATVGSTTIVRFEVETTSDAGPVMELSTSFGFFDAESLSKQAGLPVHGAHDHVIAEQSIAAADVSELITAHFADRGFPAPWLQMVDGAIETVPGDGAYRLRRSVQPGDWFFRAHFFQDPVMPGSLGIEGMMQGLALALAEAGHLDGRVEPRFVGADPGRRFTWSYRGQVRPERDEIQIALTVTAVHADDEAVVAVGDASLYVDGVRIYEVRDLSARVEGARRRDAVDPVSDGPDTDTDVPTVPLASSEATEPVVEASDAARPEPPPSEPPPSEPSPPEASLTQPSPPTPVDRSAVRSASGLLELPAGAIVDLMDAWSLAHIPSLHIDPAAEAALKRGPAMLLCLHPNAAVPTLLAWRLMDRFERRVTPVIDVADATDATDAVRTLATLLVERSPSSSPAVREVARTDRTSLVQLIEGLDADLATLRSVIVPIDAMPAASPRGLGDRLEPWLTVAARSAVPVVPVVFDAPPAHGPVAARLGEPIEGLGDVGIGERRIRVAAAFEALLSSGDSVPDADPVFDRDRAAWAVNAGVEALVAEAMVAWQRSGPSSTESERLLAAAGSGQLLVDGSGADDALATLARWGLGPWGVEIRTTS